MGIHNYIMPMNTGDFTHTLRGGGVLWYLGFGIWGVKIFGIWDLGGKIIWDLGFGENIWDLGFEVDKF